MCVFCEIIKGNIPSKKEFENENFVIINDVNPLARHHYLAIPKNHYKYLSEMNEQDKKVLDEMLTTIPSLQNKLGLDNGYRLIINQGDDAGQTVPHRHIHIIGGETLGWSK